MNTNEIEVLLEKYLEGNSSLQEEKILRDFFRGQDVPAHLKSYQLLFNYYSDEQREGIKDQDFEQKLTARLTHEQTETTVVQMHPNRNRLLFITGIAASILLLIGIFYTLQNDVFKKSLDQTGITDTEIAFANASEALMLVSGNLNNGLKQVERLQMVDKAIKDFELFHKFYQYQTIIINPDELVNQSKKSK
jgi:hypothetical protein